MARVWSETNREIHSTPQFTFSGTIDFDHGTYNITKYTKAEKNFNTHLIMELWDGFPEDPDSKRLKRLFYYYYPSGSSASTSAKVWAYNGEDEYVDSYVSVKFKGTFTPPAAGRKDFYIISFCGSHRPKLLDCSNIYRTTIYPWHADYIEPDGRRRMDQVWGKVYSDGDYWEDMGKGPYWISANQALVPHYTAGKINSDHSTSGTTIIVSPIYQGENVHYCTPEMRSSDAGKVAVFIDGNTSDKHYVDLGSVKPHYQFTGLQPNSQHVITIETYEQDDNGEPNRIYMTIHATTHRCIAWPGSHTDSTVTFNYHISKDYVGDVIYWYVTDGVYFDFIPTNFPHSLINNPQTTHTDNGWGTVTIEGIDIGTKIRVFVAAKGLKDQNGDYDAIGSTTDTTWMPTSFEGMDIIMTGTTITMTPLFNTGDEGDVEWKATLGKDTVSGVGSDDKAKFKLLENGNTYTIVFRGLYANAAYVPEELKDDDEENDDTENEDGQKLSDLYQLEMEFLNTEVYYSVRTYAVQLKEREIGTNSYACTIYQTPGAAGEEYKQMIEHMYYPYDAYCTRRDGNVDNGVRVGWVSIEDQHATVRGLEPSTSYRLYVWLNGCKDFEGYYDAVSYIDFVTKPSAVAGPFGARVTGRTITIKPNISRWNGSESLTYEVSVYHHGNPVRVGITAHCDKSVLEPVDITGLENGEEYTIRISAYDNNFNDVPVDDIKVITYEIEFTDYGIPYTRSIRDLEILYTDGEKSSGVSQDPTRGSFVRWWIVNDFTGEVVDGKETINCRRSNPNRFSSHNKLLPDTAYTMYAEIDGVEYLAVNDTQIQYSFTTCEAAYGYRVTTDTTGETLSVIPRWYESSSPDNEVTCNIVLLLNDEIIDTKTTKKNGEAVWFVNLLRGTKYDVIFTATDNEGNTTSDYIFYYTGNYSVDDNIGGHTSDITYKLTLHSFDYTTRSMQWSCSTSKHLPTGRYVEYYLDQGDEDIRINFNEVMSPNQLVKYLYLFDETPVKLKYRIQEMKDQKGRYDTEEELTFVTKKLTVYINGCTPHVDHVFITCQAYADGVAYDNDYISNTDIAFVDELCHCEPVRDGKGTTGDNSGTYAIDKTRRFNGLTGGREYYFNIGVTDGMNISNNFAENMAPFYTLVELIRIYHDGHYWTALPFVFHTGEWYRAPAYLYGTRKNKTKWWHTNPERDYPPEDDG